MILDLGGEIARDPADSLTKRALAWEQPLLPGLASGTVRRWRGAATWIPPETHPLCRHRALDAEHRVFTVGREPPPNYQLEFDLGVLHRFALPGTRRLVDDGRTFTLTDEQNELPDELHGLGYVEQAPLPMLEVLELRRMPSTDQHVLIAGSEDPLYEVADPVAPLGWIEPFPIHPRRVEYHTEPWGVKVLRRNVDRRAWRHRYSIGLSAGECDTVALGSLLQAAGANLVALRPLADGRIATELAGPSSRRRDPILASRWIVAPLGWAGRRPQGWAFRATGSRFRNVLRRQPRAAVGSNPALGWLRRTPAPGFSPLFSAAHPVTGDQFLTRSELEAKDLGYHVDGILGFISDAGADSSPAAQPQAILWGSRFGVGRRYIEGPMPQSA